MRKGWRRKSKLVLVSAAQVASLLRPVIGDARIAAIRPVAGGLVNTNIAVAVAGWPSRLLLRLYSLDPAQARKEAAVSGLVGYRVPTAEFLHFDTTNPVTGRPYAVLAWVEGMRLDRLAARSLDQATMAAIGAAVGRTMACTHSFRFSRAGFLTPDLRIPTAIDLDGAGLLAFMRQCLREGPGGARLGAALTEQLFAFANREAYRLDAWLGDPCLVHGDFNPTNILIRRDGGQWGVAAVLDWEFALSATPALDFGNLLRPPLGRCESFVGALALGYRAAGGILPFGWRQIARIADLFAWVDQLGQAVEDPALVADARSAITETVDT